MYLLILCDFGEDQITDLKQVMQKTEMCNSDVIRYYCIQLIIPNI